MREGRPWCWFRQFIPRGEAQGFLAGGQPQLLGLEGKQQGPVIVVAAADACRVDVFDLTQGLLLVGPGEVEVGVQ